MKNCARRFELLRGVLGWLLAAAMLLGAAGAAEAVTSPNLVPPNQSFTFTDTIARGASGLYIFSAFVAGNVAPITVKVGGNAAGSSSEEYAEYVNTNDVVALTATNNSPNPAYISFGWRLRDTAPGPEPTASPVPPSTNPTPTPPSGPAPTTYNISGRVTDEDGHPGVKIMMECSQSGQVIRRISTDESGYYVFYSLPPEAFNIAVSPQNGKEWSPTYQGVTIYNADRSGIDFGIGTPPLAPRLAAQGKAGRVVLSWTNPPRSWAIDMPDDYYIYRRTAGEDFAPFKSYPPVGYVTHVEPGSAASWADTNVQPDTTYYYVIEAWNGSGCQGRSNQAAATPSMPVDPSIPPSLAIIAPNSNPIGTLPRIQGQWSVPDRRIVDRIEVTIKRQRGSVTQWWSGNGWVASATATAGLKLHANVGAGNGTSGYWLCDANTIGGTAPRMPADASLYDTTVAAERAVTIEARLFLRVATDSVAVTTRSYAVQAVSPVVTITVPGTDAIDTLPRIQGQWTISDGRGYDHIEVTIRRQRGDKTQWWSGTGWVTSAAPTDSLKLHASVGAGDGKTGYWLCDATTIGAGLRMPADASLCDVANASDLGVTIEARIFAKLDGQTAAASRPYKTVGVAITQSDATPNPAMVDEEVQVNLTAALQNSENLQYTSYPTWAWDTDTVEWRANLTDAWSSTTPGYDSTIAWYPGDPTATHWYVFHGVGYWRIKVSATATYATSQGSRTMSTVAYIGKEF